MPTERPIIFNGAMIRALLDGTKTQTRRVVKGVDGKNWISIPGTPYGCNIADTEKSLACCPYGVPGDKLWVRESWKPVERESDSVDGILYAADGTFIPIENTREASERWVWVNDSPNRGKGRPSIHMPRWASRTTLEVTEVRVERVQEISGVDARAEGVLYPVKPADEPGQVSPMVDVALLGRAKDWGILKTRDTPNAREWTHDDLSRLYFSQLWDSINARRPGCSWSDNPWTWAVSFRRLLP